jgi:hypothetical protein
MTYFKEKTCFFQKTKTDFSQKSSKVQDRDRTQTATWIGTQAAAWTETQTWTGTQEGAWTETQTWTGTQAGPGQRHRHEQGHGR